MVEEEPFEVVVDQTVEEDSVVKTKDKDQK